MRLVRADGAMLVSQPEMDTGGGRTSRAALDGRLGLAGRIDAVPHSDGVTRDVVVIPTGFLGTAVTVGIDPRAVVRRSRRSRAPTSPPPPRWS